MIHARTAPSGRAAGRSSYSSSGVEADVGHDVLSGVAFGGAREQLGQPSVGVGSDDQIERGHAGGERRAMVLRHAAADTEQTLRVPGRQAGQVGQASDDALLGVLADRARVQQDDVGGRRVGDRDPAMSGEMAGDELAVGEVHLTAVRLEIESARHGPGL